jgi:hypothetical protein
MNWLGPFAANFTALAGLKSQIAHRPRVDVQTAPNDFSRVSRERFAQIVPEWGRIELPRIRRRA